MVFLKILPLLIPLIIFIIPIIAKNYVKFLFTEKTNKNDLMFECDKCGTYSHESIVIKKEGKNFCSNECASA